MGVTVEVLKMRIQTRRGACPWCGKQIYLDKYNIQGENPDKRIFFCSGPCRKYWKQKHGKYDPDCHRGTS